MPLSWNEVKTRALAFTNELKDEVSEDAEAKVSGTISLMYLGSAGGVLPLLSSR